MKKCVLAEYVARGRPLVEVTIVPANRDDCNGLARDLDALAEDLAVYPHWGNSLPGTEHMRLLTGQATTEALARLFGWKIERVELRPDCYVWEERNRPSRMPSGFEGRIASLELSQPGHCNDGQPDEIARTSIDIVGRSETGPIRSRNEDGMAFLFLESGPGGVSHSVLDVEVDDGPVLLAVADGCGGPSGECTSAKAFECLFRSLDAGSVERDPADVLHRAIADANTAFHHSTTVDPELVVYPTWIDG